MKPSRREPRSALERRAPDPVRDALEQRLALARAERELVRVHFLEQGLLLRAACRLRRAVHAGAERLAAWRERCAEELELARADGVEPPAVLRYCAERDPSAWPPHRALADASLELDDCAAGRRLAAS